MTIHPVELARLDHVVTMQSTVQQQSYTSSDINVLTETEPSNRHILDAGIY